ncbi:MAG: pentapeptide repeat-containing protein [Anaerolineae bacterium]|nr:pentapeptide repeat-containing protein [Anaerolineae bacterium]
MSSRWQQCIHFKSAGWQRGRFSAVNLRQADFEKAALGLANLNEANLEGANLQPARS